MGVFVLHINWSLSFRFCYNCLSKAKTIFYNIYDYQSYDVIVDNC